MHARDECGCACTHKPQRRYTFILKYGSSLYGRVFCSKTRPAPQAVLPRTLSAATDECARGEQAVQYRE